MGKIYFGGNIITLEEPAEAILIENDKIIAVGKIEEMENISHKAEKIDLKGNTLIPSFIDAHSHITAFASTLRLVPMNNCKSFADITKALTEEIETGKYSENRWLVGYGYDHNQLSEKSHPNKEVLDRISKDIPVMLCHASGHMGCVNSKILEIANINSQTDEVQGGKIGKDEKGEPNGYLEERAFINLNTLVPPPSLEENFELLEKAQKIYASFGITTVQDGLTGEGELKLLKAYAQKEQLYVDVVGFSDLKTMASPTKEEREYHKKFKIGGRKIFLDGSPQGKTAWMRTPYKNEKDYSGYPIYSDEEVMELCQKAKEEGCQLLAHCNGDKAAEQFLKCLEKVKYPKELRPVMIHAQLLGVDQLKKVKELGVIPSYFVAHTYYWGDVHIENFGYERAAKISPTKSSLDEGIIFTFHQDSPVIFPNMLETMWCAVNRKTIKGVEIGKEEAISTLDALKAVTINSAYQYGEESEKGSIKQGKYADFVILSKNPLTEDLKSIEILETISKGKTVYKK